MDKGLELKKLDEVAKKLGYVDAEHLERNVENYGEPLPQWWAVVKKLVNRPIADSEKMEEIKKE